MKKIIVSLVSMFIFLGVAPSGYALSEFSTNSAVLVVPRISVDGNKYFDNVSLELDFNTGKFKLLNATPTIPPQPDKIIETQLSRIFLWTFKDAFVRGERKCGAI